MALNATARKPAGFAVGSGALLRPGLRIASSCAPTPSEAASELRRQLGTEGLQHIVAFYCAQHDADALCRSLSEAFPGIALSGCSTAGEITPGGMTEGGILLIGFPEQGFRIHASLIEDVQESGVERAADIARTLKSRIDQDSHRPAGSHAFALMLVDGLSNCEEQLMAAVHWAINDMQLIGGSAGDGLKFHRTSLIHDGRVVEKAAILIMVETAHPFRVFKTQNFDPTPIKLVVTAADTENRIVHELNAEVAAREYAAAIGLMPDDLGPFSFASYPLVVKVGGDYYCRSIRNMNPDGSLSFFCAIDEGLVFTVARPKDMVRSTLASLEEIDKSLGGIGLVLGFDCILRRLDAENRQMRNQLEDVYKRYHVVGFQTYGEQYNAMHLNQTLTGIAFGAEAVAQ